MELIFMPCNSQSLSSLNESFAQELQHCLIRKFKKVPAASTFANAFNAYTNHIQDISRDTARKWITGQTIPELDRLVILKDWINLDLNGFGKKVEKPAPKEKLLPNEIHNILKEFEALETEVHSTLAKYATRLRKD